MLCLLIKLSSILKCICEMFLCCCFFPNKNSTQTSYLQTLFYLLLPSKIELAELAKKWCERFLLFTQLARGGRCFLESTFVTSEEGVNSDQPVCPMLVAQLPEWRKRLVEYSSKIQFLEIRCIINKNYVCGEQVYFHMFLNCLNML